MATTHTVRPSWYTDEDDTAWERVKAAFRRDLRQTKHDLGGAEPDLDQHVGDTVSQVAGSQPIPPGNARTPHPDDDIVEVYTDNDEDAYRYGYAASRHFDAGWDEGLEGTLRHDWNEGDYDDRRNAIRRGYIYGKRQCGSCEK